MRRTGKKNEREGGDRRGGSGARAKRRKSRNRQTEKKKKERERSVWKRNGEAERRALSELEMGTLSMG